MSHVLQMWDALQLLLFIYLLRFFDTFTLIVDSFSIHNDNELDCVRDFKIMII